MCSINQLIRSLHLGSNSIFSKKSIAERGIEKPVINHAKSVFDSIIITFEQLANPELLLHAYMVGT